MMEYHCSICERITSDFPSWDKRKWACRACWNGYVAFRRAYKAEHGHFPKIADYKIDDEPQVIEATVTCDKNISPKTAGALAKMFLHVAKLHKDGKLNKNA